MLELLTDNSKINSHCDEGQEKHFQSNLKEIILKVMDNKLEVIFAYLS